MSKKENTIYNYSTSSKQIIIVTKYFGYNFTGATLATHELAKQWEYNGNKITVLTKNVGEYDIKNIKVEKCNSSFDIVKRLRKYKHDNKNLIVYSDDHIGFIIKLAGLEYYHTYHANWPEAKNVDLSHFIKSFGFIPMYKNTIKGAKSVIAVSYYSKKFLKKYNSRVSVIRNGIGRGINKFEADKIKSIKNHNDDTLKIIMIGSVDKRKYVLAKKLFSKLEKSDIKVSIDIYGNNLDHKLTSKLESYSFVNFKGFSKNIQIDNYDLLMSTSKMENLSIAICEALERNVPVITFDIGGLGEVITNGKNGFLIEEYNIDYFIKIIEFIRNEKYIFKFDESILSEFNWKESANRYLNEFQFRRLL